MVLNFKKPESIKSYLSIGVLGRSLKLNITYSKIAIPELNQEESELNLVLPITYKKLDNIEIVNFSIQKLYDEIANNEIEYAMEFARHTFGFSPEDYKIKRLNNSYYKCSNKVITINPDIVQFSREIIYTTIIRAFCNLKYRGNSKEYQEALEFGLEKYKTFKEKNSQKNLWLKVS